MTEQPDIEARVSALEQRIEEVAADAKAARHLSAVNDRDLSALTVKVDANRTAIDALSGQTAGGFREMNRRFAELELRMDTEFTDVRAEMRAGFGEMVAGFGAIGSRLDVLIERGGDS